MQSELSGFETAFSRLYGHECQRAAKRPTRSSTAAGPEIIMGLEIQRRLATAFCVKLMKQMPRIIQLYTFFSRVTREVSIAL